MLLIKLIINGSFIMDCSSSRFCSVTGSNLLFMCRNLTTKVILSNISRNNNHNNNIICSVSVLYNCEHRAAAETLPADSSLGSPPSSLAKVTPLRCREMVLGDSHNEHDRAHSINLRPGAFEHKSVKW